MLHNIIQVVYFIVAVLFIVGLKQMSSPRTARRGIVFAGYGMAIAVGVTLLDPHIVGFSNYLLIIIAIAIGGIGAYYSGKLVAVTNMPQMIAIYNGMGGGAAAAIACAELLPNTPIPTMGILFALIGSVIGSVSFSGSLIAFAKLQGWQTRSIHLPEHNLINSCLLAAAGFLGLLLLVWPHSQMLLLLLMCATIILGILVTLPIGGANMPVVISLFNAMTGLAVAFEGFVLNNSAMIIAGTVVGASGSLLTQLMARAMNQSIRSILFTPHVDVRESGAEIKGSLKAIEASDAAVMLAYAKQVIIVPGYGMAVAQAQHKVWELTQLLEHHGVTVKFAIHPVAGRMPGHMNVLLAEAGMPYDKIFDLEDINSEFKNTDVAIVIGANDVVNPSARSDRSSPIFGMPILNVDQSKNVIVIKRGQGKGFSGIENSLFCLDHARMLYGDGAAAIGKLITEIKSV